MVHHEEISINDTIVACSTPAGKGGIGVIRASGPAIPQLAQAIGGLPKPRYATLRHFTNTQGECLDEGLALYFPTPHSFTGEDVLEFHGHGGPVVIDCLLEQWLALGARMAGPGEFSERAFLNGKIDLVQAEAIADLIDASSKQAARSAARSLSGEFSNAITKLAHHIIELRVTIESTIDFSDQDIELNESSQMAKTLTAIIGQTQHLLSTAQQGHLLREGIQVAIVGPPNAGKSSLLNGLAGYEAAIVTDIPGTTRDLVREQITVDGLPLHIVDTAGLRESNDRVEQEGIHRAKQALQAADGILWVFDCSDSASAESARDHHLSHHAAWIIEVANKMDLTTETARTDKVSNDNTRVYLSVKTGDGLPLLIDAIKQKTGYQKDSQGVFIARRRHLDALQHVGTTLEAAYASLTQHKGVGIELAAEQLNRSQYYLSTITGEVIAADDLLGEIFSRLCIGK